MRLSEGTPHKALLPTSPESTRLLQASPRDVRKGSGTLLPASFIGGALLTLCVVFLTGSTVGVRWQRPSGLVGHTPGTEANLKGSIPLDVAALSAAHSLNSTQCPEPQQPEPCPMPEKPPPCPACEACEPCPTAPPAPAPCPACPAQEACPKAEPCVAPVQQADQAASKRDDKDGVDPKQHIAEEKAGKQAAGGKAGTGTQAAAPAPLHMPWKPLLAASEVQRGIGYYGSGGRLEAVVAKLLRGEAITAYALGGSVTKGSGASSEETAYPGRFFEFIRKTFPHKDHVLVNKGVGATSSGIFSACIEHMVPNGADLAIIEFTMNEENDAPYTKPQRRGYEQLVRKLLRMPGPPAIIQMHHYAWWRAHADGVEQGIFYFPQAEAQLYVFSQYYDIPSVSLRSAIYHLMRAHVPRFDIDKVQARHKENISPTGVKIPVPGKKEDEEDYFFYDRTHPGDLGHQVIAELLAGLVFQAAERLQVSSDGVSRGAGWAAERTDAGLKGLPPPMIPDNEDAPSTLCAMQEDFEGIVKDWEGFEFKAERPKEESFVLQKWGWTSNTPGHWAELEFDSRPTADTEDGVGGEASIYLTHLKSYEGMGTASVECVSGCKCGKTLLDGTWETQSSLMQNLIFKVSPAAKCRVRVTVLDKPGKVPQKGGKVKLMGIMASHFPLRVTAQEGQTEVVFSRVGL